jgi:hypothetical protein
VEKLLDEVIKKVPHPKKLDKESNLVTAETEVDNV